MQQFIAIASAHSGALLVVALAGALAGTFVDRWVRRMVFERSLLWPIGSYCERCYQRLPWYSSLPIVGYWMCWGRCPTCSCPLPKRRWILEPLAAGLFVALYFTHVLQKGSTLPLHASPWYFQDRHLFAMFVYHAILTTLLLAATFIDLDRMIIPDAITVPGMFIGVLLGTYWHLELHPVAIWLPVPTMPGMFPGVHWATNWNKYLGLATGLAGLFAGGAVVWTVREIFTRVIGREAMGFGDVTLMAMAGSFLGWQTVILAFFFAVVPAVFVGSFNWLVFRNDELPYGPHLSISCIGCIFLWRPLWAWLYPLFQDFSWFLAFAVVFGLLMAICARIVHWLKLFVLRLLRSPSRIERA